MEHIYPSIADWLPKLKFVKFVYTEKRCGCCKHSYCHNPGAYITGLSCKIIESFLDEKEETLPQKDSEGNRLNYTGVVGSNDICSKYKPN